MSDFDYYNIIEENYDPGMDFTKLSYSEPGSTMGFCFGTITDIDDPEGRGRLKVHIPAVEEAAVTDWAPFIRPYASNEAGYWYSPRPGDKVICGFIEGKPEQPVILGFIYTSTCKPPVEQDDQNNKKEIVSREGTRIELYDGPGEERISIVSKDEDMVLQLDESYGILLKNEQGDIDISCKKFFCGGAGVGLFQFKKKLTIEAEQDIRLGIKEAIVYKAQKEVKFSTGENLKLLGNAGVTAGMWQMAAQNDRVLGIDIHKQFFTVGSASFDLPLPHPFIGKLVDKLSENVFIGDRNAAVKGSIAKHDTGHILWPLPFTVKFSESPKNEGPVEKGTAKHVLINNKEAAVFLSKVQDCNEMNLPFIGEGFVITPGVPMIAILFHLMVNIQWTVLEAILSAAGVILGEILEMICNMLGTTLEDFVEKTPGIEKGNFIEVETAMGNPVINVVVILTLRDDTEYKAATDAEGKAHFEELEGAVDGVVWYEDDEDFYAKSVAADMNEAINSRHFDYVMQRLDDISSFSRILTAFKENYSKEMVPAIQGAFSSGRFADLLNYMLVKRKLIEDEAITIIEDTYG